VAGDYIQITEELDGKPEVILLSRETGRDLLNVLGALQQFWMWAQKQTVDGRLRGMKLTDLPNALPRLDLKFFEVLASEECGWLIVRSDGLFIPNFKRWLGNSAKSRLKARGRKRRQRDKEGHGDVTPRAGRRRDRSVTNVNGNVNGRERRQKEPTLNVRDQPEEKPEAEETAAARAAINDFLVDDIVREFNDEPFRNYYRRAVGLMHPDDVRRAMSETRSAKARGEIRTTVRRYLIGRLKDVASSRGLDLSSPKPTRRSGPDRNNAGDRARSA